MMFAELAAGFLVPSVLPARAMVTARSMRCTAPQLSIHDDEEDEEEEYEYEYCA